MASGSERHDPPTSPAESADTGGRLPEHVYRRRRMVALAVIVVLLGLFTWGLATMLSGSDTEEADPSASLAAGGPDPRARPAAFAAAE